jgi:hypothetical protein
MEHKKLWIHWRRITHQNNNASRLPFYGDDALLMTECMHEKEYLYSSD